jgi:hypothetical protein
MKKNLIYLCALIPSLMMAQQNQSRLIYNSLTEKNQQLECIPKQVREIVDKEVEHNILMLRASGKSNLQTRSVDVLFDWPLRLAQGRPNLP